MRTQLAHCTATPLHYVQIQSGESETFFFFEMRVKLIRGSMNLLVVTGGRREQATKRRSRSATVRLKQNGRKATFLSWCWSPAGDVPLRISDQDSWHAGEHCSLGWPCRQTGVTSSCDLGPFLAVPSSPIRAFGSCPVPPKPHPLSLPLSIHPHDMI